MANLQEKYGLSLQRGEVLFREGETGDTMFVLQKGRIRITRVIRGEEKVLTELGPGEFFGEMAILNNKARSATATAVEDATLLRLDMRTFTAMIKANTEIAVRMIKKLAGRLDAANEQIETLLLRDANSRVVHALITLCKTQGEPGDNGVRVHLSAAELGARVGLESEITLGVLSRMQRSQLISVTDDYISVHDVGKLDEFLEFLEMKARFGDAGGP